MTKPDSLHPSHLNALRAKRRSIRLKSSHSGKLERDFIQQARITLSALFQCKTTVWEGVPEAVAVILFFLQDFQG
jgi:hypothetical protein